MGWLIAAIVLVALVVLAPLAVTLWQAWQLVHPTRKPLSGHPSDHNISFEEASIASPVGNLAAWYLPGTNGCTLIALHGINDNRQQWLEPARDLQQRGYGSLLIDFRGHGQSAGHFVTYGLREVEDVRAALEYLRARGDVDMHRVGVMGLSLGGIVAIMAAARLPEIRAVVTEAAFPDLLADLRIAFRRFTGLPPFPLADLTVFWGQLIVRANLHDLRAIAYVDKIAPRALLVISDLDDTLVPEPRASEELFAAAGEPKEIWQLPDVGHVHGYDCLHEVYIDRIAGFFANALS